MKKTQFSKNLAKVAKFHNVPDCILYTLESWQKLGEKERKKICQNSCTKCTQPLRASFDKSYESNHKNRPLF